LWLSDKASQQLAFKIKNQISQKCKFPGIIIVNVIRQTRFQEEIMQRK